MFLEQSPALTLGHPAVADARLDQRRELADASSGVRLHLAGTQVDRESRVPQSKMSGCAATTFAISVSFTLSFCEEARRMSNAS